jgi:BirA family biotin operon repressor/biotin-[acetyl-CoA-carboxylase] ligase
MPPPPPPSRCFDADVIARSAERDEAIQGHAARVWIVSRRFAALAMTAFHLDPSAAAAGARLLTFDSIGSTNAEALTRARQGETGTLWLVARRQTGGHGRRGRTWVSEPGNLYATLLLSDPSPAARVAELSFVAALALHDAVVECAAMLGPRLSLKWPNDVLCDGRKFSGILLEGEGTSAAAHVALGIGVNCAHHPKDTTYPATDLAAAGVHVVCETLFTALSRTMLARVAQWRRGENFQSIRADWLRRADGLGKPIRVRLPDRELTGTFEALDDSGCLLLRRPNGAREAIAAGDVFPMQTTSVNA